MRIFFKIGRRKGWAEYPGLSEGRAKLKLKQIYPNAIILKIEKL